MTNLVFRSLSLSFKGGIDGHVAIATLWEDDHLFVVTIVKPEAFELLTLSSK